MALQRLRVLLVEDEPGDARLVISALRESRSPVFSVVHETTLAGAIGRVQAGETFDVVLLDLSLPDSRGGDTLARMQAAERSLPIVIMTGLDDPLVAEGALEAGAQDYLVKSDEPERTVARSIRYAISRKHAELERQALADRLAVEYERIAEELALARTMQFDLLPRVERLARIRARLGLAVDGFFEPSSNIGGDLWGCAEGEGGRAVFYTFDFSGHGVGAALNVFRLHTLISELEDRIADPAATLAHLNRVLFNLLPRGQYATMVLTILDTEAGTLTWSAAGSPSPILFDADGGARLLDSRGKPLGISASAQYTNRVTEFPPRSSLFLYSDVMLESTLPSGEMLGEEGLLDMVRGFHEAETGVDIPRLSGRFVEAVGSPLADDMTAVCITRLPLSGPVTPLMVVDAPVTEDLIGQVWGLGAAAHPFEETLPTGTAQPLVLASASPDTVAMGLASPYSGFFEIIDGRLVDIGSGCLDAVARGGFCLSVSTSTAWSSRLAVVVGSELRRRFGHHCDWESVDLCLGELIANSIIHGNLAIQSGMRETREGLDRYSEAIRLAMSDPARAAKRLELTAVPLPAGRLQITVSDRGAGFDFAHHDNKAISPGAKHGQGLALIHKLTETVTSLDGGRTIVIVVQGGQR